MNKHTLENIIIFSVHFCESCNSNKGVVYESYISEKSKRYLDIDVMEYDGIDINDFGDSYPYGDGDNYYTPHPLKQILENLSSHKIDLHSISKSRNVYDNIIYGLDMGRTGIALDIINSKSDEYYCKLLREYNIDEILK